MLYIFRVVGPTTYKFEGELFSLKCKMGLFLKMESGVATLWGGQYYNFIMFS